MNFYSVFNVLFPRCVTHKKKSCVYFSNFPYIHLFPWENWIGFIKTFYLILVNLQVVAGSKKCYFRQQILPVTAW